MHSFEHPPAVALPTDTECEEAHRVQERWVAHEAHQLETAARLGRRPLPEARAFERACLAMTAQAQERVDSSV